MIDDRPLLERGAEVAALGERIDAARGGVGSLTVVQAGPGLGKSALLAAAAGLADGLTVLRAHGSELERDFAFGGVRQLLEPTVARLPAPEARRVLSGGATASVPLLSGGSTPHDGPDAAGLLHSLYWVVANLADRSPVLVVVDDLHWMDQPSRRFLLHLGRRVPDVAVAAVIASRPESPGVPDGADALSELPGATGLVLSPLSDAAVLTLRRQAGTRGRLDDADLVRLAAGNPLVVGQLLDGAADPPARPRGAPDDVEALVRRSVDVRLRRLDAEAVTVLQAAALVEDATPVPVVAAMASLSPTATRRHLTALVDAALVSGGSEVGLTHPMVRAAVRDTLTSSEAAVLHERAVEALVADGAGADLLAPHLAATPPCGDTDRFALLHKAGRAALAAGAPEAAARWLRRAHLEPPPAERRLAGLTDLVRAEIAGHDPRWRAHLDELEALGPPAPRASALARIGDALLTVGSLADAATAFRSGLTADGAEVEPGGELHLRLVAGLAFADRTDPRARAALDAALSTVLDRPASTLTAASRALLAQVAFERARRVDQADEVRTLAHRALDHAGPRTRLDPRGRAFHLAVLCLTFLDEWTEARAHLDHAVTANARAGRVVAYTASLVYRARVGYHTGAIDLAHADVTAALAAGGDLYDLDLPGAAATLALIRLEAGEAPSTVLAGLRLPHGRAWEEGPGYDLWLLARSQARLATGDPAGALADARSVGDRRRVAGSDNPATAPWRRSAALALQQTGHDREAIDLLEHELALARAFGAPRLIAVPLRLLGQARQGTDPIAGLAELEEAEALLDGTPCALERSRTRLALGAAIRRLGRPAQARVPLREALHDAEAGGARAVADAARAELRLAGGRARRTALSGPDSLTPGERRVAEMAATGLTNREVAQRLFVTVKAVEFHLGNAYAKLGVRSRRELPAALAAPRP